MVTDLLSCNGCQAIAQQQLCNSLAMSFFPFAVVEKQSSNDVQSEMHGAGADVEAVDIMTASTSKRPESFGVPGDASASHEAK